MKNVVQLGWGQAFILLLGFFIAKKCRLSIKIREKIRERKLGSAYFTK